MKRFLFLSTFLCWAIFLAAVDKTGNRGSNHVSFGRSQDIEYICNNEEASRLTPSGLLRGKAYGNDNLGARYLIDENINTCLNIFSTRNSDGGVDLTINPDYDTADITTIMPDISLMRSNVRILPEPDARLNYTQIMFEHPKVSGADKYIMEITLDEHGYSFKHPLVMRKDSSTATMISNFEFGKKYVWRYAGVHSGKELEWNGPYNFEILNDASVDKKQYRVRVLKNDFSETAGGLLILDHSRSIVDRNGNYVWFFPRDTVNSLKGNMHPSRYTEVNDLRITPMGTVTCIKTDVQTAEERDLKGNILWQAPSRNAFRPDSSNPANPYSYHHCFKRLLSGNYMVLDIVKASKPLVNRDSCSIKAMGIETVKKFLDYELLREIDRTGNLVWSWSSEDYFDTSELRNIVQCKPGNGLLNPTPGGHLNAFEVDETSGFVYAGFRNVNRIIKIDKKTGQVVCSWGNDGNYRGAKNGDEFFSGQHGITLLRDGSIAVYNNNPEQLHVDSGIPASSVVIFTQPSDSISSQLIWKFYCRLDSVNNISTTAGNIDELKNGNLLVCMGRINRVFEITRNKRIVWSSLVEKYEELDSTWHGFALYRAHYTSSLYPCYFTIQTNCDTLNKAGTAIQLKIFNDGTENDSYDIKITSTSGFYDKQFSTGVLPTRKSITFEIAPDKSPLINDKIVVCVKSKTNPDFKRTDFVQYIK